jgi:hypothetical protein
MEGIEMAEDGVVDGVSIKYRYYGLKMWLRDWIRHED